MKIKNIKSIESIELADFTDICLEAQPYTEEFKSTIRYLKEKEAKEEIAAIVFLTYIQKSNPIVIDHYPSLLIEKNLRKMSLSIFSSKENGFEMKDSFIKSKFSTGSTLPQINSQGITILSAHLDSHFVQAEFMSQELNNNEFTQTIFDKLISAINAYKLECSLPHKEEKKKLKI